MKSALIVLLIVFFMASCNYVATPVTTKTLVSSTTAFISPAEITTSAPLSTKVIASPTSTALSQPTNEIISDWLPYNPNISNEGCNEFTATIPIKDAKELSKEEIIKKLFEMYLEHFKSPDLGGICRLEEFKIENIKMDQIVVFTAKNQRVETTAWVNYSIKIKEVPSNWVAGNGELAPDGWIIHKRMIIGFMEIDKQYVLILVGTGP